MRISLWQSYYYSKIDEAKMKLNDCRKKLDKMNYDIQQMIKMLNKVSENMEIYYKIYYDIIHKYEIENRNDELFQNINEIEKNINCSDLDSVINNDNYSDKFTILSKIYNKIKKPNEMIIIYNIHGKLEVKLFSKDFVKNNKNNCKLIIHGKEEKLCEYLDLENLGEGRTLEIILKEINPVTNMVRMFKECTDLISLRDFSEWDTSNVTDMHSLFNGCISLSLLSDISKWNTSNLTTVKYIFWNCILLDTLPYI